jgi:hypothetical protein
MWLRIALLAAIAAACSRNDPGRHATQAECEAMFAKILSLTPAPQREIVVEMGFGNEASLKLCRERTTYEVVACVERATSLDQIAHCRATIDVRPPDARRTREECERYVRHIRDLVEAENAKTAAVADTDPAKSAAIAENLVDGAKRECDGWLSSQRFDCVVSATTTDEWAACPP